MTLFDFAKGVFVATVLAHMAYSAWRLHRIARRAEYRLSRAQAAAYYYRLASIHFANRTGSAADVDEVAATAAARDGDDLTADDLRREAGAPDKRDI
jgi:hypothetical protein